MDGFLLPHPPLILAGIGKDTDVVLTKKSYKLVKEKIQQIKPDICIIISPHCNCYVDGFFVDQLAQSTDNMQRFNSKINVLTKNNLELAKLISKLAKAQINIDAGGLFTNNMCDHGSLILITLLDLKNVLRIGQCPNANLIEHYKMGMIIKNACQQLQLKVVFLASGDLSHCLSHNGPYPFNKNGKLFDETVIKCVTDNDFSALFHLDSNSIAKASECGLKSLAMLLGFLDGYKINSELLSYEAPYGVGYMCASFHADMQITSNLESLGVIKNKQVMNLRANCSVYVQLAHRAISEYVKNHLTIAENVINDQRLLARCGCFVSIHKSADELRGCIGTIIPQYSNLANEIIHNAIAAAANDYRFSPILANELDDLVITVDLLGPILPVLDLKRLNPKLHGLIVKTTDSRKSGLLLPNLDGVDTIDQQIKICKQKGGIKDNENVKYYYFTSTRYE
jgi:AmmeMemoRadiSam system protein A